MRDLDPPEKYVNIWDDTWIIVERDDETTPRKKLSSDEDG
jgi:hypothetical protein